MAEAIETIDQLDKELKDLQDPKSLLYQFLARDLLQEYKCLGEGSVPDIHYKEVERRRRWREKRLSPARCLECGSPDILLLPSGVTVQNPGGAGTVVANARASADVGTPSGLFTPEGLRIINVIAGG